MSGSDPYFGQIVRSRDDGTDEKVLVKIVGTATSGPGDIATNQAIVGVDGLHAVIDSVPLAEDAATETKQDAGNALLESINTHIIKADTDTVTIVSSALPGGAATSTLQSAGNASLASLDTDFDVALSTRASEATLSTLSGKVPNGLTVSSTRLLVDNSGVTQPVSGAVTANQGGTWNITNVSGTVSLPTGASTEATLSTLNGKVPSNLTVTSTRLLVDGSGVTQPVSGTLTVTQPTGTNFHAVIDASALPALAATSTLQTTANTSLSNIDAHISSIDTDIDVAMSTRASEATLSSLNAKFSSLGQKTMAGSAAVVIASDQSAVPSSQFGTWNINNVSGAVSLPTGASTSANQATLNTSIQILDDVPTAQNAAFSKGNPIMGQMDDAGTVSATEDNCSSVRITQSRAIHVNQRTSSGAEIDPRQVGVIHTTGPTAGVDAASASPALLSNFLLGTANQEHFYAQWGRLFTANIDGDALSLLTEQNVLLITNPNASGRTLKIHSFRFSSYSATAGNNASFTEWSVYIGPTVTSNGASFNPVGARQSSQNTSVCSFFTGPTTTALGNRWRTVRVNSAVMDAEVVENFSLWLEPNNKMLITATPLIGGVTLSMTMKFAEE
jgi:hypothetical protein